VQKLEAGIALTAGAMLVNAIAGLAILRTGRRHGSIALEADGKHLLGDAVTTAGVLVALGLVKWTGRAWVDPVAAVLLAAYISLMGYGLLRRATAGLMDEQDAEDDRLIRSILDAHAAPNGPAPRVCSYHKLRHRHSGRFHWVDFHVMVPADWTIERGHEVASALEFEIERALGEGNATAHVEPCVDASCPACMSESQSKH
jgi:cation diffusion facilitator family transporter